MPRARLVCNVVATRVDPESPGVVTKVRSVYVTTVVMLRRLLFTRFDTCEMVIGLVRTLAVALISAPKTGLGI